MKGFKVEHALVRDMKAVADIFRVCFCDSILFHCGKMPHQQAMQDIFTLVWQADPQAALVVRREEQVVGYCFCPADISRIYITAFLHGHIIKMIWRYITGRYGIGIYPLKMLFLNKMAFFASAFAMNQRCPARILSVAVLPEFQGQGLATMLLEAALSQFSQDGVAKVRLEVRPENLPAIRVYEKAGFTVTGTTSDPQGQWVIMFRKMR